MLAVIDPATGATTTTAVAPLGFTPRTATAGLTWGVESGTGQLLGVDSATGVVVDHLALSANGSPVFAQSVVASSGVLWITGTKTTATGTTTGYLYRVDPPPERSRDV